MNIYAIVIVSALIGRYLVDLISDWLNIQSLTPDVPHEVRDVFNPEEYRRSHDYTKVRTRFDMVRSTIQLLVLLSFWFLGGFNQLDLLVRSWNLSEIKTGILFIGLLLTVSGLLSIPFAVYSTFVIEERFGFNKTTVRVFITDLLKGFLLSVLLGVPLLATILWFFQATGASAWLYCWIFAVLFLVVVHFIAPVWIMPLFNKFTPLETGDLKQAIESYARSVHFSFKEIFVMDGSKRSTKANAFFTGFGNNKRIALFDTLVSQNTVPEVVAVLAHEIGHYKMRHILKMMALGILQMGILFFLLSLFMNNRELFDAFKMENVSIYGSIVFFSLLYEPVSFALSIMMNAFSRKHELQADRYAVKTTDNREYMVSSLKKLSVQNLSNLTPHPLHVFLNYSHPPLLERIRAIRAA